MTFKSVNPANGEILASFEEDVDYFSKIREAERTYNRWKTADIIERIRLTLNLANILEARKTELAKEISLEMGKTLKSATAEIEKCAVTAKYYCHVAEEQTRSVEINNYAHKAYYRYESQGGILAVMPWNFPYWQALRFAIPTILTGNVVLLKHAPNVFMSATTLEKLFMEAGFEQGVFQNLFVDIDKIESIVADPFIKGVTLTGSNLAGSSLASLAGKYLKKSVLELGGSDPFVVLADANIENAATFAVKSRFQNAGQTCIAAKRWIVVEEVYEEFLDNVSDKIKKLKAGDPFEADTDFGPVARLDLAEKIEGQIDYLVNKGAIKLISGVRKGCLLTPTLLELNRELSHSFTEELFGPVACIIKAKDTEEAIEIANETSFGLGASLWTQDLENGEKLLKKLNAGNVYLNSMVKSDASMPFGGINQSGYGRELGVYGLYEFCNVKSYIIEK
ncbi:aldehyde dehydrogenase family protein [Lacihabitans soyangensis]|uniref:Aldehyde dehydrogenase family protein n=1 Tax=Lacihabitans soyangensis TaxID=869394 RepID=A0AAE3H740_9BACT|nr:aldehyde dehydrogenase family protein [Lacihabitans soyangensis]MCP9765284.1 aldehyde dehydrogenase family protein [Lacihabitans soyangensis]